MIHVYTENQDTTEELYERVAAAAFETLNLIGEAAVELLPMVPDEIRRFNRNTRGVDRETDVLSYPAQEEIMPFTVANYPFDCNEKDEVILGSILLCREVAERQAAEYGHSVERELAFLFLHGLLHLLGYDHVKPRDEERMKAASEQVLAALGIER